MRLLPPLIVTREELVSGLCETCYKCVSRLYVYRKCNCMFYVQDRTGGSCSKYTLPRSTRDPLHSDTITMQRLTLWWSSLVPRPHGNEASGGVHYYLPIGRHCSCFDHHIVLFADK